MTGASLRSNAVRDPLLPADRVAELTGMFLAGADPRDPRASPLYAEFPGCPPVMLTSSRTEILFSEVGEMANTCSREVKVSGRSRWSDWLGLGFGRVTSRERGGAGQKQQETGGEENPHSRRSTIDLIVRSPE